jgi:hypothetical protein
MIPNLIKFSTPNLFTAKAGFFSKGLPHRIRRWRAKIKSPFSKSERAERNWH